MIPPRGRKCQVLRTTGYPSSWPNDAHLAGLHQGPGELPVALRGIFPCLLIRRFINYSRNRVGRQVEH